MASAHVDPSAEPASRPPSRLAGARALARVAAAYGALAWSLFALCEQAAVLLATWNGSASERPTSWDVAFAAAALAAYPVFGAAATGLAGMVVGVLGSRAEYIRRRPRAMARALAAAGLLACFGLHLASVRPSGILGLATLAVCGAAFAGVLASALPGAFAARLGGLSHPFVACLASAVGSWTALDFLNERSRVVRLAALAGMVAILAWRQRPRPGADVDLPKPRTAVLLVAASLIAVALTWANRAAPPEWEPGPAPHSNPADPRPNVLLVVLDTVRADHLSLYGYGRDTSDGLSRFAAGATLFEEALAPGDMTLSSHASLFTGLYASEHGAHFDERGRGLPLASSRETLAERLSARGYATLGVAANHVFFGQGFGLEQGFEYFDAREPDEFVLLHRLGQVPSALLRRSVHRWLAARAPEAMRARHYRRAEDVVDQACALLARARDGGRPFFLFVNFMDAHWPYAPPSPWDGRYPGKDTDFTPERMYEVIDAVVARRERALTDSERAHLESQYDGAIAYEDSEIERLLHRLAELGLESNTLVVVTSDHGEALGERDLIGHALSVHQDQVRVPLLVRLPGGGGPRRVSSPVSLVDLVPAILAALGIEVPPGLPGRDLFASPSGVAASGAERALVSESFPNRAMFGPRFQRTERALVLGALKLIGSSTGARALYDLAEDPGETRDLFATHARSAELQELLAAWLATLPARGDAAAIDDPETIERLKVLGYAW